MPPKGRKTPQFHCEYFKEQHGYVTGCGYRAAYNKHWWVCPYCGRLIHVMNRKAEEE